MHCCSPTRKGGTSAGGAPLPAASPACAESFAVALSGGTFLMGTDYPLGLPQDGEGPVRPVRLSPFQIDTIPVTNERFAQFVQQTDYRTDAERLGSSFVFAGHLTPASYRNSAVVSSAPWWVEVDGACWHMPEGPGSDLQDRSLHPVVQVSWNDANAFCAWSGQRLPTEAEWEYSARGGLEQKLYPWGDDLLVDGAHQCNLWQGIFPSRDDAEDGYRGTCPVRAFPPNGFGLYSAAGNTWEWCSDYFGIDRSTLLNRVDPQGPPNGDTKVLKGGSFLCHASYCNRYRVAARTASTQNSSASNIGFRCASAAARCA